MTGGNFPKLFLGMFDLVPPWLRQVKTATESLMRFIPQLLHAELLKVLELTIDIEMYRENNIGDETEMV